MRMKRMPAFRLQFEAATDHDTAAKIRKFAAKYLKDDSNEVEDQKALEAGRAIRNGCHTEKNFRIIYEWKLASYAKRNLNYMKRENMNEAEIADALRLAVVAQTSRSAVSVLIGLPGVRVRVASAILAMIYPDRYTVLDVRALKALGLQNENDDGSIDFYQAYLNECQKLTKRYNVDLRTLDRALFWWSEPRRSRSPPPRLSR